jgi:hypothetical protein
MARLNEQLVTGVGAAAVAIGFFALLDAYWRWIGVALGYPPVWSGATGAGLLLAGIVCLLAGRQAKPSDGHATEPDEGHGRQA